MFIVEIWTDREDLDDLVAIENGMRPRWRPTPDVRREFRTWKAADAFMRVNRKQGNAVAWRNS